MSSNQSVTAGPADQMEPVTTSERQGHSNVAPLKHTQRGLRPAGRGREHRGHFEGQWDQTVASSACYTHSYLVMETGGGARLRLPVLTKADVFDAV